MPYDPSICFDFPEEAAAYIDKLEEENARLKAQIIIIADAHINAAKEAATLKAQIEVYEAAAKQEPVAWGCTTGGLAYKQESFSPASRKKLFPLYAHPKLAMPEGWKLVPIKATDKMLNAGRATYNKDPESQYNVMLKAAPTPEGK